MQDLREAMYEHYRLLSGEESNEAEETALQTGDDGCSKHANRRNGRNSRDKGKNKFNGTCNNCGNQGYEVADCCQDEKNAIKRPVWWKKT